MRFALSIVIAILPLAFSGCGGGGAGTPNPISGEITGADFIIPAGETRTATGDLTVRTTNSIVIDGTLLIVPGVDVKLFSDGIIAIRGRIAPSSRAAASRRHASEANHVAISADTIRLL